MKKEYNIEELVQKFKEKSKIALARLITILENQPEKAPEIFKHFQDSKGLGGGNFEYLKGGPL